MSACLGAVVRAPVTGILIVFEMTNEFYLVPALMLGALISSAVSKRLLKDNFYEAILEQDGYQLEQVIPPRDLKTWQQLPVSAIANFSPVVIEPLTPESVESSLRTYPYHRFPVTSSGRSSGGFDAPRSSGGPLRKQRLHSCQDSGVPSFPKYPRTSILPDRVRDGAGWLGRAWTAALDWHRDPARPFKARGGHCQR